MDGDCYITLLPYAISDHERIFKSKTGPHQRIKVSGSSTLGNISNYALAMAGRTRNPGTHIALYVQNGTERLSLPLSLSVGEFLSITNQTKEGSVYYSFVDPPESWTPPPPAPQRERPPPPPSGNKDAHSAPVFTPPYHSGISMLSNSFGSALHNSDSRGESQPSADATETSGDLRRQLEALLSGSSPE
jgi:hypothetical protein